MESKMTMKDKDIVVPGDLIASGDDFLPGSGTYKENGEVRSKILGTIRVKNDHLMSIVPLAGQYMPYSGDGVIGKIADVMVSAWMVDVGGPYMGFLPLSEGVDDYIDIKTVDLTQYFDVDDVIYAKIINVSKRKDVKLSMRDRMCRKLHGGNVIRITPAKVPRLIGTGGSMIEMIKNKTSSHIIVGQNGLVWIKGGDEKKAADVIYTIERESHTSGLTERIQKLLGEGSGKIDQ